MANLVSVGFEPFGTMTMGMGTFPNTLMREVANNYGTALFQGDILKAVSDGTVAAAAASDTTVLAYVATGFSYVISNKRWQRPYVPANTTFTPTTVGSPAATHVECLALTSELVLAVSGSASTGITTIAGAISLIHENCDLAAGGGGNTTSGASSYSLDISTHNTTAKNFRVVGIQQYPTDNPESLLLNNDPTLTNCKYLVVINQGFWPPYATSGV